MRVGNLSKSLFTLLMVLLTFGNICVFGQGGPNQDDCDACLSRFPEDPAAAEACREALGCDEEPEPEPIVPVTTNMWVLVAFGGLFALASLSLSREQIKQTVIKILN